MVEGQFFRFVLVTDSDGFASQLKNSAYSYHMSYAHGISNVTGLPFSPPTSTRSSQSSSSLSVRSLLTTNSSRAEEGSTRRSNVNDRRTVS